MTSASEWLREHEVKEDGTWTWQEKETPIMLKWMKHLRDKGYAPLVALGMVVSEFDSRFERCTYNEKE